MHKSDCASSKVANRVIRGHRCAKAFGTPFLLFMATSAHAAPFGGFAPPASYAVQSMPQSIVADDLDGDGHIDLVAASNGAGVYSVLRANGDGTFQTQTFEQAGLSPVSLKTADLNKDGDPDLIVANSTQNTVSVSLGMAGAQFGPRVAFAVGDFPYALALDDFNGDDHLDIVVSNAGSGALSLLYGLGDGAFAPMESVEVGLGQMAIDVGRFNGDQHADIVLTHVDDSISVLLGDGAGGFTLSQSLAAGFGAKSMSVGDVNGDTHDDFIVSNAFSNSIQVFLGAGDGTFASLPETPSGVRPDSVALGNLDGDAHLDLAFVNETTDVISVFLGHGDGTFQAPELIQVGFEALALVICNVDDDGLLDIAVATGAGANNFARVLLNQTDVTAPGAFDLMTPFDAAHDVPAPSKSESDWLRVTLDWSDAAPDFSPVAYRVTIAFDPGLSMVVFSQDDIPVSNVVIPGGVLLPLTTYYWSVEASNTVGASVSNPVAHQFSTGVCSSTPGDLNGDGQVDGADLAQLLGNWAPGL